MLPEALEINRAWGGGPVMRWIWQQKTTTLTLITRWTLTHIPFFCLALPAKNVLNLRQLLYHFSVLVKPRLGFLAKLAKRTRRLIIFHKSWRLSPNAMRGIPKGAGQCSVFPVAINTDGSAATQGRQQCKIFLCLFGERKPQWSKSCEKQIRGRGQSLSRWWEKQIKCEASSRGNHDTQGCNLPSCAWVGEPL